MKSINLYLFFVFSITILSCNQSGVYFTSPQPEEGEILKKFPKHFIGNYITEDGEKLVVTESKFILHHNSELHLHPKDLDSTYSIEGFFLKDLVNGYSFPFKKVGDSIQIILTLVNDTIELENSIIKKYKGFYFLNRKHVLNGNLSDSVAWEVLRIKYKNKKLEIARITNVDPLLPNYDCINCDKDSAEVYTPIVVRNNNANKLRHFNVDGSFDWTTTYFKIKKK